jgi:type IV fimbrial biogenesis protein FimT
MHPVMHWLPASRGFSMLEMLVAIGMLAIVMAVGVPAMSDWMMATKAGAASEFYIDGLRRARDLAISNNAASRFRLTENTTNGQLDWQIDLCFPTATLPCNAVHGDWSTTTDGADGDPHGASTATRSIFRSADSLPKTAVMQATLSPSGATDVYFTSVGWVNTAVDPRLARIELAPAAGHSDDFSTAAVAITLSGNATKCDPTVGVADSRACPP